MAQRCPRCGTNNRDESRFCLYCGATLPGLSTEDVRPAMTAPIVTPASPIRTIPPPVRRERTPDFVGLLGFAFFLLVLGVVFYLNQNLLTNLRQWWDQILERHRLLGPDRRHELRRRGVAVVPSPHEDPHVRGGPRRRRRNRVREEILI